MKKKTHVRVSEARLARRSDEDVKTDSRSRASSERGEAGREHELSRALRGDDADVGDDVDEKRNPDDLDVESRVREHLDLLMLKRHAAVLSGRDVVDGRRAISVGLDLGGFRLEQLHEG
jgi:hypothetical protein